MTGPQGAAFRAAIPSGTRSLQPWHGPHRRALLHQCGTRSLLPSILQPKRPRIALSVGSSGAIRLARSGIPKR